MRRHPNGFRQKVCFAFGEPIRRPWTIEKTGFVEPSEKTAKLALANRGAPKQECGGELLEAAASIEQRQHIGCAIRHHDRTDLGVGRIAQHERASAALVNREDLYGPQARVLGQRKAGALC